MTAAGSTSSGAGARASGSAAATSTVDDGTADRTATVGAHAPGPSAPTVGDALAMGAPIGRYLVLDVIGTGGMGVVYLAYDPGLDRKVAIKLLNARHSGEAGRQRILREAQAMAKLSHGNVVAVYDVGAYEGGVFVAMELVRGVTLRHWLKNRPRWQDALDRFVEAGRGLVAAHEVGIVHRDFKPANVMIDARGVARVLDFGVARIRLDDEEPSAPSDDGGSPASASQLTAVGAAIGTPHYMPPEQRKGLGVDARADQYAFCVALYEALYGRHPRAGVDGALVPGDPQPPPDGAVPARVGRIVMRGLAARPDDRYPTMAGLLHDLARARGHGARQRRWLLAGVTSALVAAGAVVAIRASDAPPPCTGAAAELVGVWDPDVAARAGAAFAGTGLSYAAASWRTTSSLLDRYASRWTAMHRDACLATEVRHVQSAELLDARMLCLSQRRAELSSLAAVLTRADGRVVERALDAVNRLPDPGQCADVAVLGERERPPGDPAARAELAAIGRDVADARAASVAGDPGRARDLAAGAVARAGRAGYAPLEADAHFALAQILAVSDPTAAERELHAMAMAAERGRDELAKVNAWAALAFIEGVALGRLDDGERWLAYADALRARIGDQPDLSLTLLRYRGVLALARGDVAGGSALYRQALDLAIRTYGPDDVHAGVIHRFWANGLADAGDFVHARDHGQRELEIFSRTRGVDHPQTAVAMNNLARTLRELGELDAAEPLFRHAIATWERAYGPEHGEIALSLYGLGMIALRRGHAADALPLMTRAREITARSLGEDSLDMVVPLTGLAEAYNALGQHDDAVVRAEAAARIVERATGADNPYLVVPSAPWADGELGRGQPAVALPILERAQRIAAAQPSAVPPGARARIELDLARALTALGRQPERVRALIGEARQHAADAGSAGTEVSTAVASFAAGR